jgi:protein-S-isoprenylcysteine O-methyltransferase Ste14
MNGFLLLLPFLLIRFGVLSALNKDGIKRAAHFAPMAGNEIAAYWIYQLSNIALFGGLCFLTVIIEFSWQFYAGLILYLSGLLLCAISVINFAYPSKDGLNYNGIYGLSRNPMYLSYFICFIGCALLTQSWILFGIVLVFQISSHWIILSEERWCVEKFGDEYKQYMRKVRRYI